MQYLDKLMNKMSARRAYIIYVYIAIHTADYILVLFTPTIPGRGVEGDGWLEGVEKKGRWKKGGHN